MTKNSGMGRLAESVRLVKARSQYRSCGIASELAQRKPPRQSRCARMAALKHGGFPEIGAFESAPPRAANMSGTAEHSVS